MQKLALFVAIAATTLLACVLPKMPFMNGGASQSTQSAESRTVATSETHTVNGHPVDKNGHREDLDQDDDAPKARHKANRNPKSGEMGATCRENSDCESNTCYVGSGELGYCTQ